MMIRQVFAVALFMSVVVVAVVVVMTNSETTTTTTTTTKLFCRIQHTDVLMMVPPNENDDSDESGGALVDHGITECYPTTATSSSRNSDTTVIPLVHELVLLPSSSWSLSSFLWSSKSNNNDNKDASSYEIHHSMMNKYLQYDTNWIDTATQQIHIPYHIHTSSSSKKDESILKKQHIYDSHHPIVQNHLQQQVQPPSHHRTLEHTVTDQNRNIMLAVRVSTFNENVTTSIEDIQNYLFNTNSDTSFTTIHSQCTLQQKNVVPYNSDIPVYDIQLNGNSNDYTFGSFFTAAEPILTSLLFDDNTQNNNSTNTTTTDEPTIITSSLSDIAEYVLLIGPKGLRPTTQQPNFRFVAAGSYDSYKVVVTDDWIDTPQVIQHEIGYVNEFIYIYCIFIYYLYFVAH
jgi:hypothetical protein